MRPEDTRVLPWECVARSQSLRVSLLVGKPQGHDMEDGLKCLGERVGGKPEGLQELLGPQTNLPKDILAVAPVAHCERRERLHMYSCNIFRAGGTDLILDQESAQAIEVRIWIMMCRLTNDSIR